MSTTIGKFGTKNTSKSGIGEWFFGLYFVFVSVYLKKSKTGWERKADEEVSVRTPQSTFWTLNWDATMGLLRRIGIFLQVVINCLAVAACGMTMAFPAVALPALASSGHTISANQVSLVGCACYVMILIGSYSGGVLSEKSGRRKSLLAAVTPSIVGWVVTGTSDSMIAFVSGLMFLGIGMGLSNSCAGVYLTELVSNKWRRVVSAAKGVAFSLGITLIYVLGFIIRKDWKRIALISSAIPASAFVLGIVFLRESGVWLRRPRKTPEDKYFCGLHRSFWSALVKRVEVYKFFYPFNAVIILFQLSGATVLITFAISLLDGVGLAGNLDPYILAIALGLSHMVGPVLAEVFSLRCGVRRTLVYSATFMSLSILFLARLHRISGVRIEDWPPFTAEAFIAVFVCTSSIFTSVTGSHQERIFPADIRRACSSISTFNSWIGSCVAVVTYPVMAKCLGFNDIFMIYAICCVLCAVLTIMLLPEVIEQPISEVESTGDSQQLRLVSPKPSKVQTTAIKVPPAQVKEQPKVHPQTPTKAQPPAQPKESTEPPKVQPIKQPKGQPAVQPVSKPSVQPQVQPLKTQIKEQPPKLTVQPKEQPKSQPKEGPKIPPDSQVQPKDQLTAQPSPKEQSKSSIQPKSTDAKKGKK